MRSTRADQGAYASQGAELPLSGLELGSLMAAVLSRGRAFRFKAKGESMLPFVCDGDVLTLSPLNGRRPRLGELVAFTSPRSGLPMIHRVVGRRAHAYLMQGDAVHVPDGWVDEAQVVGRVTATSRGGREIRLGRGPERVLLAAISRAGLWRYVRPAVWWLGRRWRGLQGRTKGHDSPVGDR